MYPAKCNIITLSDLRAYARSKGIDLKKRGFKALIRKAAKADGLPMEYISNMVDLL